MTRSDDACSLNERLNAALEAYARLVDLRDTTWAGREEIETLNASRDLDPSGVTTCLLLRGLLETFLATTTFSAKAILASPDLFMARLTAMQAVRAALSHPSMEVVVAQVRDGLQHASARLGFGDPAAFSAFLDDINRLGIVRRDARQSLQTLTTYAFTKGALDAGPLAINQTIFECWNINSLLHLLQQQSIAGVSLCLIRDPAAVMESYFVFAIRSGDVLVILTDREAGPHPDHACMSRCRDRALERRAARHWFPYGLLDLTATIDAEGYQTGLRATARTGVVRQQAHVARLSTLSALRPEEFAWTIMVLQSLAGQYVATAAVRPAVLDADAPLAYTGEMLTAPHVLVEPRAALMRQGAYTPLALAPLHPTDVTRATLDPQWERPPVGWNDWMLDRYLPEVPETVYDVVVAGDPAISASAGVAFTRDPDATPVSGEDREVSTIHPTTFGTAHELQRDRLWVARRNQVRDIRARAFEEFETTRDEVLAWCAARLRARLPDLIVAVAADTLLLPDVRWPTWAAEPARGTANGVRTWDLRVEQPRLHVPMTYHRAEAMPGRRLRSDYTCALFPGRAATWLSVITPTCPAALARLYDVAEADLPWGLQHWYRGQPYVGNPILSRLDPADWALDNPWCALDLRVLITLSRTGRAQTRKRLGLALDDPVGAP